MKMYLFPILLLCLASKSNGQERPQADRQSVSPASDFLSLFQPADAPFHNPAWPGADEPSLLVPDQQKWQGLLQNPPQSLELELPQADGRTMRVRLERVNWFSEAFTLELHTQGPITDYFPGIHYRGEVVGRKHSLAALSFYEDEISGLFAIPEEPGNWMLGRYALADNKKRHLLYRDAGMVFNPDFQCQTTDQGPAYNLATLQGPHNKNQASSCVDIYYEVDYDIFREKGGKAPAIHFVTSLFNQIAAVYAHNDLRINLAHLYLWNAPSPYNGPTSEKQLAQFQEYRKDWPGDLAQLLSFKVSGGIAAGFLGLCAVDRREAMSYAGIHSELVSVPNYSWSVNVSAHELGHLLGSRHTHACAWNGNGTSIDDCGNIYMQNQHQTMEGAACFLEGPGNLPIGGGTLMSYCHLLEGVGINLSRGFHDQPLALIHHNLENSSCLDACESFSEDPTCFGRPVNLKLITDRYGSETTWKIRDKNGIVLYQGGPYENGTPGKTREQTLCLGNGCYSLEIFDAYGDGICCRYGNGALTLTDTSGLVLATAGRFSDEIRLPFCLEDPDQVAAPPDTCLEINFNHYPIIPYGGQDHGRYEIRNNGETIRLYGNAWKAIPINYVIKPETILEFDFGTTSGAEVHAIGMDTDDEVSSNRTFKLFGSQNWGNLQYFNYQYPGEWKKFSIPIGYHYTGPVSNLFLCVDDDDAPVDGDSWFRRIRIYEYGACETLSAANPGAALPPPGNSVSLRAYPNPAREDIHLVLSEPRQGDAELLVFNLMGQLVKQQTIINLADWTTARFQVHDLPAGSYLFRMQVGTEAWTERIVIVK